MRLHYFLLRVFKCVYMFFRICNVLLYFKFRRMGGRVIFQLVLTTIYKIRRKLFCKYKIGLAKIFSS